MFSFNFHIYIVYILSSPEDMLIESNGGGGERERERETDIDVREKHRLVASLMCPNWGGLVLTPTEDRTCNLGTCRLEIKHVIFLSVAGQHSN